MRSSRAVLTPLALVVLTLGAKDIPKISLECGPAVVMIINYAEGQVQGQGSGFIVDSSGIVVTSYHVIQGADKAEIKLLDARTLKVKGVYGYDPQLDIAVLKIDGRNLPHLELGNSDALAVGEGVVAIGNPKGLENTVTEGILSGRRNFPLRGELLQISAPISPGSSGGALLDSAGLVVGVTSASFSEGQNLNFAIPINQVKPLLEVKELSELAKVSGSIEGMSAEEVLDYAWYAMDMGDFDRAEGYFRRVIDLDPDNTHAYLGLGHLYYRDEKYDKAAELYRKVIEVADQDRDKSLGYASLGLAYYRMNKNDDAITAMEQACELNPYNIETLSDLGYLYEDAKRYNDAIAVYRKVLESTPSSPAGYLMLGNCQIKVGDWSSAKECFEKALVIKPDLAYAHVGLGQAYLGMGKSGTASDEFEKALAMRSSLRDEAVLDALDGLGQARLKMGHHKKAEEAFKEMLTIDPHSAKAHYGLGLAYIKAGDLDAAERELETLKGLDKELAAKLEEAIRGAKQE